MPITIIQIWLEIEMWSGTGSVMNAFMSKRQTIELSSERRENQCWSKLGRISTWLYNISIMSRLFCHRVVLRPPWNLFITRLFIQVNSSISKWEFWSRPWCYKCRQRNGICQRKIEELKELTPLFHSFIHLSILLLKKVTHWKEISKIVRIISWISFLKNCFNSWKDHFRISWTTINFYVKTN